MEKQTSSANRLVLKRILTQDGNNRCADCKTATHPRWASWNIGILICIRCSGIHRSLGTHISKVRSIDLDTWNDTQLEKLIEHGNIKANLYWESQLPDNYVPDESKIMNFIKTKYELKRWIPTDNSSLSKSHSDSAKAPAVPPKLRSNKIDLLDLDGAFSVKAPATQQLSSSLFSTTPLKPEGTSFQARSQRQKPHPRPQQQPQQPLKPQSVSLIQGISPSAQTSKPASSSSSFSSSSQSSRADVKKSILSLYSQPSKPAAPANNSPYSASAAPAQFTRSSQPLNTPQPAKNSLSAIPTPSTQETRPTFQDKAQSQSIFVEDDDFANVWK